MNRAATGRVTNKKEIYGMKKTLLLAALIAFAGVSASSAGELLQSPRGKANQTQFVRAEARVLGGRADRSTILASPRHAGQQDTLRKEKSTSKATPTANREKSLGGRNSPK